MKNLTVRQHTTRNLELLEKEIKSSNNSRILCAVNSTNDDVYVLLQSKLCKISSNSSKDVIHFDLNENVDYVSLEYCSIMQELYAASKSGKIMRMNVEGEFQCVPMINLNVEIQYMKLSPDHEVIVLVTTNGIVITMVYTFQVISEVDLHAQDFGQKQFVTVGWGKKETQFHGSEGKQAATAKPSEITVNDLDDRLCRITWREDGTLFAVSFINSEKNVRQFKVFDREGVLQFTSQVLNGLGESLSWKPSGSLIATTQVLQNKYTVALFEKNGLKHREFSFPFNQNEMRVKDLFWSPDSEILTVWCKNQKDSSSLLQLWTENNYHWYLKQSMKFSVNNSLIFAAWSTATCSKKLILLTETELVTYDYNWVVNHSKGKTVQDKSVVGVIDGDKLLMTSFRVGIVPPPMAHQTLELVEPINAIVFAPAGDNENNWIDSNTFFCISNRNKLTFYSHTLASLLKYECIGTYDIKWNEFLVWNKNSYNIHHFLWIHGNRILCSVTSNNKNFLCTLALIGLDKQTLGEIRVKRMHTMDGLIQQIIPSPDNNEAYVVTETSVVMYTKEDELIPTDIRLEDNISKMEIVNIGDKRTILSLHYRNCFAIDGKQIAHNITSFFVQSDFLLLTTTQNALICVQLNEKEFEELVKHDLTVKPWENGLDEKSFIDLNVRRVERGSQIIVTIPQGSKTVLQMPRGNLECIQPRPLSLNIIGFYLDSCRYLEAFHLMRKQRINLNLIYDHDPKRFEENAHKFIQLISNANWLSLFLSELMDEDVSRTIYANYYRRREIKSDFETKNKTESVCNLMRNIMERRNTGNSLIQPILISLVKLKRQQGMEAALSKIKELRKLEDTEPKNEEHVTSDEALKYLLYIVDVNTLFDIALGMYDFDLTMFIASKSHKDPKEYIPFLNNLKKLSENYMKYSIDLHLKHYDSALAHIANETSRFNESMNLIRNHNLYMKALKLFGRDTNEYKEIAKSYGEFLLKKQHYQEAGIMFYRSGYFKNALNAYNLACNWCDVITLSAQVGLSEIEKRELYRDLVGHLKNDKKYMEAALILSNYLKDAKDAIDTLCMGKHWKDAVRVAYDSMNTDLIESSIKSSVYENAECTITKTEKNKQDFEQYRQRLIKVRENISCGNANGMIRPCDSIYDKGISDILSDTSSIASSTISQRSKLSTLSGKSYRSSKNRRKQERKFLSLKEGSAYEDLALIHALYQIVNNTYKEQDDLRSLIQMLVYFEDDVYAEKIQSSMDQFLSIIEKSKFEIWDKSAVSNFKHMENAEFSSSADLQAYTVFEKFIEPYITHPPMTNSAPWKLSIF